MDYAIRPLTAADEPLLWDMLYQGLQTGGGEAAPGPEIVERPELARYVRNWGKTGDTGFVAHDVETSKPIGAVWLRSVENEAGVQAAMPELALAVNPVHRRHGIGAALLTQLVKANPEQSVISMRVLPNNPVVRLYERFGFKVVGESEKSVTMRREA